MQQYVGLGNNRHKFRATLLDNHHPVQICVRFSGHMTLRVLYVCAFATWRIYAHSYTCKLRA